MPEPIPLIKPKHEPHHKDVYPGSIVILRGIMDGKSAAGLVEFIHPMDVMLEDSNGEMKPWNGTMPIVDIITVQAIELEEIEYDAELGAGFMFSRTKGEVIRAEKIPFYKDVERQQRFSRLPRAMQERLPRYVLASEIRG